MRTQNRAVLVVGGAGFIGSHLLRTLAESGKYRTIVCADVAEPRFKTDGVFYKYVDIREPIPDDVCPGAEAIFNLAAVHTTPGHEDWEYYWTNVLGAIHVSDYARRIGARAVVFTSSISVYGPSENLKDEDSALEPESAYGKSKLCAEKIHRQWLDEHPGVRKLVIARPAVIYGYTERGNFTRLAQLLKSRRFVYPGRKDTIKSCGYVEDLIGSFHFMLERPEPLLIYNFAHPERYSSQEICNAFEQVAGYPAQSPVIPIPLMIFGAIGFEVLGKLGLKTSINRPRIMKLYHSTNIYPKRLVEMGYPYQYSLPASLARWQAMGKGEFV